MIGHGEIVSVERFVDMIFDTDWYLRWSNELDVDSPTDDSGVNSEYDIRGGVYAVTERSECDVFAGDAPFGHGVDEAFADCGAIMHRYLTNECL